ncbi:MAG TPA: type II secretion system protein [Planctomycetota bacterium]|nr:type II secretion system protein [Planctomycetota bacterium]
MFNRRPSGFTLLELLVVISIIAILAVSLTPAFSRAREAGRRSVCSDNLKQIHMCLTMYEQTEGMFPTRAQGTANQYTSGDAQEALNLLYRQYTDDIRIFSCPSKILAPSMLQNILPSTATGWPGSAGTAFQEAAAGSTGYSTSYGYSPGHNSNASRVVVAADHQGTGPKGNSDNHGKDAGQNMLSAGGAVQFYNVKTNALGKDDNGADVIDSDIFTYNTITPNTYVDWDSNCR